MGKWIFLVIFSVICFGMSFSTVEILFSQLLFFFLSKDFWVVFALIYSDANMKDTSGWLFVG